MTSDSYLQQLVLTRCRELGAPEAPDEAAKFFEVSPALVRQWMNGSKRPSLAAVEKVFALPQTPTQEADWSAKEVFIAMPVYRTTNPRTMLALLAVWDRSKFGFRYRWGDAFIAHTRNRLANDFENSGMPFCWWVDDDVVPPMGNAGLFNEQTGFNLPPQFAGVHAPAKLRSRGVSLIGGLYYGRWRKGRAQYAEAIADPAEDRASRTPRDIFKPTAFVATGCLLHTRQVLTDIRAKFPHLAPEHPTEPWHYFSNASDQIVGFFNRLTAEMAELENLVRGGQAEQAGKMIADLRRHADQAKQENLRFSRLQQGEDNTFCKRAAQAGHKAHVDLGVICGHSDGSIVWGPHNTDPNA